MAKMTITVFHHTHYVSTRSGSVELQHW